MDDRYDEADAVLTNGMVTHSQLESDFAGLEKRQISPDFQAFYKLAAENRVLQSGAFDAAEECIRLGRADAGVKAINGAIDAWNDAIIPYNVNYYEMGRLAQKMAEEARMK